MSKRILIIIVVIIVIVLAGFLIWYYINYQSSLAPSGAGGRFKNLFPFGNNPTYVPGAATSTIQNPQQPTNAQNYLKKLRLLSAEPVAGAGIAETKAGTVVRYIEKATGHIFQVELFSPNTSRLSNTTIPLVYDALWAVDNKSLIARTIKGDNQTVGTYALVLKNASITADNAVSTIAFPLHISDISVFGNNMFYLIANETNSVGIIASFDGKQQKVIWNSPMRELNSQFVSSNTVALTTKPAPNILGYTYLTTNGNTKKLLGDIPGLYTLVSPDASQILYVAQTGSLQMFYENLVQGLIKTIAPVAFPEKCVWSKKDKNTVYCAVSRESLDGNSLTFWYQGLASFTDDIWKYDIKSNTASVIENLSNDSGLQIDVKKPLLSDSEKYLIFENKIDNSLWSLDLNLAH